jgi:hypothetical protein
VHTESVQSAPAQVSPGFPITISYNGESRSFQVLPQETVRQILDRAIAEFGPLPNPHMLALFKGAAELQDNQTVHEVGIHPHDELVLRQSAVRGG